MSHANTPNTDGLDGKKQSLVAHSMKEALETLLASAKTLSANPALDSLLRDIDSVPGLKKEIEKRHEQEEVHKTTRLKLLEDYTDQRDQWMAEKQQQETLIKKLQQDLEKDQAMINSLKSNSENQLKRITDLEELTVKQNRDAENKHKDYQDLLKARETEKKERAKLETALKDKEAHVSRIDVEKKGLEKAHSALKSEAEWSKRELQAAVELTVALHDDEKVMKKMDKIWSNAASMVFTTFWQNLDLESVVTKEFLTRLDDLGQWRTSIPVPHSNSDAAKRMRCIIIMASLARTFAYYLFQPTYFLSEDSGLRELLMRQAQAHNAKEAAMRGHLQALLPDHRDAACSTRIDKACENVLCLVAGLLPSSDEVEFRKRLRSIADEASEVWQEISCYTEAVEPRFDTWRYNNWAWGELVFHGSRFQINQQVSGENSAETVLTIFPRLYTWYDGEPQPESHGVLLTKMQIRSAAEELERLEKGRTVRDRLPGHRRALSGTKSAVVSEAQPFLGRKS